MNSWKDSLLGQTLRCEHDDIHQRIGEWRCWWNELRELGAQRFGEMGNRLLQLREVLAAHFHREEQAGIFRVSAGDNSSLVAQGLELERQHVALLADLNQLVERLRKCAGDDLTWGQAGRHFEDFLEDLQAHEFEENLFLSKVRDLELKSAP